MVCKVINQNPTENALSKAPQSFSSEARQSTLKANLEDVKDLLKQYTYFFWVKNRNPPN